MKKFSIIVPCYNEAQNIQLIVAAFEKAVRVRDNIEVILVNNGSNDNSAAIFAEELKNKDIFKLVNVEKNQGYGFGILAGLDAAQGDVMAWTHADMQTDPNDVIRGFELYEKSENKKVFIKGKRKNRKLSEYILTLGMQVAVKLILNVFLDDINAQPKIFSREFYEKFLKNKAPYDFSLDLFALYQAKRNGFLFKNIDVLFKKRLYGDAKGGGASWLVRLRIIKRTIVYIIKLKKS